MNMLDLMNKMTELSEAKSTNNAFTGNWKDPEDAKGKSIIHKGKYGTAYQGEPDDLSTDDTKKTKKVAPADGEKRGRGRPAKGSDSSGKTTSHDTQSLSNFMIGNKPSKAVDKLPKTKSKTLKDWFERLDAALNEDGQFTVKPAAPGASDIMGPDGKKVGTASTPAAAQAVKNGEVNFDKEQGMAEGDIGKHNNATTGFAALVKKLTPKYGVKGAMRIAGSQLKKIKEADMPPNDSQLSPMSEGGKKGVNPFAKKEETDKKKCPPMSHVKKMCQDGKTVAEICKMHPDCDRTELKQMIADCKKKLSEGAKPDFLDLNKNGNKTEPMKKAAADKKAGPKKGVNPFAKKTTEALKGGQKNLDVDDDGKLEKSDFTKLRAKKKISEGKVKEIAIDLKEMTPAEFKKKYEMTKAEMEKNMNTDSNDNKKDLAEGERTMSRAAKGYEKYGKKGMQALAKAGRDGASEKKLDAVRDKHNKYESISMTEGVRHSDAAHLRGKAHAMGGENYNCRYTPGTNEANMYHMGFKEGLDECYGQMPMESYVEEEFTPESEVQNMPLMTDESPMMDESPFSWAAKNTPTGKHFTLAGHDFTKTAAESMNPFMESLDKQLNALLNDDINEGMTVSISKGQQGTPDSVSVSAQDSEAEQLLSIIKSAGLGLFGGDNDSGDEHSSAMSMPEVTIADGGAELDSNINVVNDHDGMLDLIRKMTGQGPAQSDDNDYESEEPEHNHDEEECGDCGNNPCDCEAIDEAETPDQEEFMATEDNAPDSGAQETTADENAEAAEDGAIAKSDQQNPTVTTNEDEMEEDLNESYANSAENTFEADIEFMTKVITGGLNKQKSTGQSTIPVVASQKNRLGEPMQESTALLHDWKKLSGIT